MSETGRVRVLIVDDQPLFVFALRELLLVDDRIDVVGSTDSAAEAIDLVVNDGIDVVLMDLTMPGMGGLEATRMLKVTSPGTRVVVVTGRVAIEDEQAATAAGAVAFMRKGALGAEIGDAVVEAAVA